MKRKVSRRTSTGKAERRGRKVTVASVDIPVPDPVPVPSGGNGTLWVLFGWGLTVFSLIALQDFQVVVKTYSMIQPNRFPLIPNFILMAVGLGITIFGFNRLRGEWTDPSPGPKTAGILLAAIMAGAAVICVFDPMNPPGYYWDDWANNVVLTRHVLDQNVHRLMFYFGGREPFFPYWLTLFRLLLPEVPGYVAQRIASGGVVLLTVWVLYLAGREVGSRRAGLFAAALGAVAKPILLLNIAGLRAGTLPLGAAVAVLFTLRVLRKPDLPHFLQWGAAMAFGVYTYSAYRPLMMFVPLLVLAWILLRREERCNPLACAVAAGPPVFLAAIFAGLFSATHPMFAAWGAFWSRHLANGPLTVLWFSLWAILAVAAQRAASYKGCGKRLAAWALGTGLACLLVYPISQHLEFNQRLPDVSVFTKEKVVGGLIPYLWGKAVLVVRSLFWFATDRNDMMVSYEAFFDVLSMGAYALGIAWFLGKPDAKKIHLAFMAAIGTVVLALSIDTASTKIVAAAPPLCVLAAGAGERLLASTLPRSFLRRAILALLSAGLLAAGIVEFRKFNEYFVPIISPETAVARQIRKDYGKYRVYLGLSGHFVGPNAQYALNEGRRFYYLKNTNWIPVEAGEDPQDVVVLLDMENPEMAERLRREYPRAEWTQVLINRHPGGIEVAPRYMHRIVIRGEDIPEDERFVLYRQVKRGAWVRRYHSGFFGWGVGGVLRENRMDDPTQAPNQEALDPERYEDYFFPGMTVTRGAIRIPETATYEWMITAANPLFIRVGGKTLVRMHRVEGQTLVKRLRLEAGMRDVVIKTWLHSATAVSVVLFRKVGDVEWTTLEQASRAPEPGKQGGG